MTRVSRCREATPWLISESLTAVLKGEDSDIKKHFKIQTRSDRSASLYSESEAVLLQETKIQWLVTNINFIFLLHTWWIIQLIIWQSLSLEELVPSSAWAR